MADKLRELIVFPTELSLRRFQQEQALEHGWVDASCHTTFARIKRQCIPYTGLANRPLKGAKELLMRRQAASEARKHFSGKHSLGDLPLSALSDVLDRLTAELAMLPDEADSIIEWMKDPQRTRRLRELAGLYDAWRKMIGQEGYADRLDVNRAILKLLRGSRNHWPPRLRDAARITFRSVRWFNPFEEACVAALVRKVEVRVESALPPAHADAAADRMGQRIRAEIMAQPWSGWAEDLGDALAVDHPDVLSGGTDRIGFSRSAGAYGEIEDLARRIGWHLETQQLTANRIALVVPDIGTVQDIIPHVFSRFQIPYFFRRGRPVLSSPCVKAFLTWLAFPLRPERDVLIDLIRNPAIVFDDREKTVEGLLKMPPILSSGKASVHVEQTFRTARSGEAALNMLKERIVEPDDHFNSESLKALASVLEEIGPQPLPLNELVDLTETLLMDATVKPRESHEQGVWILNPHDAVGLQFDLVLFAGLNEGEFPSIPQQDALLSDEQRYWLRRYLEEQGRHLPGMALPDAPIRFEQESVMFLSALGMAREQLVFSYQAVDQEGNEKSEGEYFRKLWNLAGWCAREDMELSPYDQWRLQQLDASERTPNLFAGHYKEQQNTDLEDRIPMPGESFMRIVPLPLCRARDEALQAAVHDRRNSCDGASEAPASRQLEHLSAMLNIEAERDAYLESSMDERLPSKYCGHIEALKERVAEWFERKNEISPTALETLAQCRYVFLIERVFGLEEVRAADDMPDPMDRGTLIHSILKNVYTSVANGEAGIDAPRCWAVKSGGGWRKRSDSGAGAIPLAVFLPERRCEYEAFARKTASERLEQCVSGHPAIWAAERQKVLEQVLNFVRHDLDTCADENRFPAMFELKFGGDSAVDLGDVRLKGRIDRVDLCFAEAGELTNLRVLDYKGSSRRRTQREEYIREIRNNLDCQLPVYAFAAQQFFFGEHNTEEVNAMTEAGYLFYQREVKEIGSALRKSLLRLNEEGLLEGFLATLSENIRRLKKGDFAVDPLFAAYNDYQSACRTEAASLDELE